MGYPGIEWLSVEGEVKVDGTPCKFYAEAQIDGTWKVEEIEFGEEVEGWSWGAKEDARQDRHDHASEAIEADLNRVTRRAAPQPA